MERVFILVFLISSFNLYLIQKFKEQIQIFCGALSLVNKDMIFFSPLNIKHTDKILSVEAIL